MKPERVLSLDVSTKTGFASIVSSESGMVLEHCGTLPKIAEPEGAYPGNYVTWSELCFKDIMAIIEIYKPDVLVIEETSKGSKNAFSQKILEYLHFRLASYIMESGIKSVYIQTEQWRREIGCQMNDKEKIKNKAVRTYKKEFEKANGKKTTLAYDESGKRIGLIGRKHVNIRRVSEIFAGQLKEPLKRKDEDLADGLGLAAAYHLRRFKVSETEEMTLEDMIK